MSTLVKDPNTGAFVGAGRSVSDLGGSTAAPANDPYTKFNQALAQMLVSMRDGQNAGMANLGGAKDALTTLSVAPGGPTAFNPNIGAGSQIQGQQELSAGFKPAITSINTQLENTNTALGNLGQDIGTLSTVYKPTALSPGQSEVTPGGQVILRTPNYQPPQIRPDTGQLDSWDAANAMWKSDEEKQGGTGLPGSKTAHVVAGVDLSTYAADPDYGKKVEGIYNTLQQVAPTPSADTIDSYIAGHAKGSPVTGQMIMQVAQHYNVDPNLLTAQLALESHFGTVGEAPKNNNPGGVMWANQPNATQGSPRPSNEGGFYANFKTPLDGLYAMGDVLSNNKANVSTPPASTTGTGAATTAPGADPKGNVFNPQYQQRISQLSPALWRYTLAGPDGVAYIDGDAVKQVGLDTAAAVSGSKAGVPVLDSNGVTIMNNMNILAQQVQEMKRLVNKNLGGADDNSTMAHTLNSLGFNLNKLAQNKPDLTEMESYIGGVTTAANNIKALAGGAGTGLRITGFEIGSTQDTMPTPSDSWQTANAKISALDTKISQWMNTNFPDVDPTKPVVPQGKTLTPPPGGGAVDIGSLRTKYKY